MKKLMVLLVALSLAGCARSNVIIPPRNTPIPTVDVCGITFAEIRREAPDLDVAQILDLVVNRSWAPGSKGALIQTCLDEGWRPIGWGG